MTRHDSNIRNKAIKECIQVVRDYFEQYIGKNPDWENQTTYAYAKMSSDIRWRLVELEEYDEEG